MDINQFWDAILKQKAKKIKTYFHKDAYINWHCTNEHFTVDEFIQANCEYPGKWDGNIERIEYVNDLIIAVVNVFSIDHQLSFHVVSFIKTKNDQIISIDEYWGDDGIAPIWRLDKNIGNPII
ncbi:hypothetical protein [Massilimicrobiota sp. An134]|uniref:hypothetical protein n=1 Tax=Massilimicrobiota sp. An134 TaxID=1965557 RepID=UPI000B380B3C|nr:hypothetical protein [Massilimicrobiota sp. An134]OUQ29872.1 hypothetical protein B5E79_05695 [Massilimicrobiota sp. An134]